LRRDVSVTEESICIESLNSTLLDVSLFVERLSPLGLSKNAFSHSSRLPSFRMSSYPICIYHGIVSGPLSRHLLRRKLRSFFFFFSPPYQSPLQYFPSRIFLVGLFLSNLSCCRRFFSSPYDPLERVRVPLPPSLLHPRACSSRISSNGIRTDLFT